MPREETNHLIQGHKPLGQILLEKEELTQGQLDEALAVQQRSTERLGQLLSRLGHVDAQSVREALVSQAGLERLDIDDCEISPEAVAALPAEVAFHHKVLPISRHNRSLSVAMADPFDSTALELLRVLTGKKNKPPQQRSGGSLNFSKTVRVCESKTKTY